MLPATFGLNALIGALFFEANVMEMSSSDIIVASFMLSTNVHSAERKLKHYNCHALSK